MEEYDVIVVGAGPAGLRASKKLAEAGLSVLCLDRKQEIGVPKQCGEGLGMGWIKRLGLEVKRRWAVQEIYGAKLYAPSGNAVEIRFDEVSGYVIERKAFEKQLAKDAAKAGAKIKVKSNVSRIERTDHGVNVHVSDLFESDYVAKVIVGADGPQSWVANQLGLKISLKPEDLDLGLQYEMCDIEFEDPELIHLYFGTEVAPRGYVWIFPKGSEHANVGIGIGGHSRKPPRYYLDKWIDERPNIKKGSILEVNSGTIPVGGLLKQMTADNLIVCGDAAHQVHPLHGGGMGLAMEAADIAAEVIKEAFDKNDFTNKVLETYNVRWWEKRGNRLQALVQKRVMFEHLSDSDFETIAKAFTAEDIMVLSEGDLAETVKLVTKKLVKHPSLLKLMLKYMKSG
jgi:digeranylgeranylglycerophospholipid reductase